MYGTLFAGKIFQSNKQRNHFSQNRPTHRTNQKKNESIEEHLHRTPQESSLQKYGQVDLGKLIQNFSKLIGEIREMQDKDRRVSGTIFAGIDAPIEQRCANTKHKTGHHYIDAVKNRAGRIAIAAKPRNSLHTKHATGINNARLFPPAVPRNENSLGRYRNTGFRRGIPWIRAGRSTWVRRLLRKTHDLSRRPGPGGDSGLRQCR